MRTLTPPPDRRRLIGLLLTVLAAGVVMLLWLEPDPFGSTTIVRVRVPDAGPLAGTGSEVRVAGTPVGEVGGRKLVPGGSELELRLDGDAPVVHRDARVEVRPRLLFEGTAFVALDPGSPRAPALGNATLPLERGRTAVSLQDAFDLLAPARARDLRVVAHDARMTLAPRTTRTLNAVGRRLPSLLARGERVATAARSGGALRRATAELHRTTAALADRSPDLTAVSDDASRVARAVRAGTQLDETLERLPRATADVERGSQALQRTVDTLRPKARDLRPAARDLEPALDDVRPLLRRATPALRKAAPLVTGVRTTLQRAGAAAPDARRVLRRAQPFLTTLQDSTLAALEQKTDLGEPAYLNFLGLFAGGGGASRPFGVSGQGHFMRFGLRFLTGAGQPLPPCTLLERVDAPLAKAVSQYGGCTP